MIKIILFLLVFVQTILLMNTPLKACSVFSAAQGDTVLVGSSIDTERDEPRAWFFPPSEGKYGKVYFFFDMIEFLSYQGGMNDQGLVVEGTALEPERSVPENYSNKPVYNKGMWDMLLEECATVDEAIEQVTKYYWPRYSNVHSLVTDKTGNSAIIEWGEKEMLSIRKEGNYQVMTNFPNSDTANARWYNCYRYKVAESMLKNSDEISIDLFRSILDAVHQEGPGPTRHSNIYDLKKGEVYVYYFYNFDEVVKFNLEEELKKGEHIYRLSQLFHQIKLRFPTTGEKVNPSAVTFIWNGNAEHYELYCSSDPNFNGCEPIEVASSQLPKDGNISFCFLYLGILLLGGIWIRKKKTLALVTCFVIVSTISSCVNIIGPPTPSKIEHSKTVENLQPNTVYYWKVVAVGNDGINSESVVQNFTTED